MDKSKEQIQSYKKSYYEDFKVKLSDKEAYDSMYNLTSFFKLLDKIDRRIKVEEKLKKKYFNKNNNSGNIEVDTT